MLIVRAESDSCLLFCGKATIRKSAFFLNLFLSYGAVLRLLLNIIFLFSLTASIVYQYAFTYRQEVSNFYYHTLDRYNSISVMQRERFQDVVPRTRSQSVGALAFKRNSGQTVAFDTKTHSSNQSQFLGKIESIVNDEEIF